MDSIETPHSIQDQPVGDSETVLRRVTQAELTRHEDEGTIRPSSNAFLQGGPDGDVSVFLASETTPERITREYPNTYVALTNVAFIRGLGLDVQRDPIQDQPGHCNITGRKTSAKRRAIARNSLWAEGFEPT